MKIVRADKERLSDYKEKKVRRIERLEKRIGELENRQILLVIGEHVPHYIPIERVVEAIIDYLNVRVDFKYPEPEKYSLIKKKE